MGFISSQTEVVLQVYSQYGNSDGPSTRRPRGFTAFGVFLLWGAATATLAGTTLVWKETTLDRIWYLNPRAYDQLAPLGARAGIPLLIVAVTLTSAGVGWFNRRRWAWSLAVTIIATQIAGDFVNLYLGHVIERAIGVAAAGALLFYLLRPPVRAAFRMRL